MYEALQDPEGQWLSKSWGQTPQTAPFWGKRKHSRPSAAEFLPRTGLAVLTDVFRLFSHSQPSVRA
jgi:hypothetical protein